jgi:hypothetical protein
MLTESKFEELAVKDVSLKNYYEKQDNGFYKVKVADNEKELLKDKFRNLGFSALNFTDSRSRYQFYNLSHLWSDIKTALEADITLLHLATEPVSAGEVYEYLTGESFWNELKGVPADYDYRTIYAGMFGGAENYISNKTGVLSDIRNFVERRG